MKRKKKCNLLESSSLLFTSNSLLGGYFGKLDGSQAYGFVLKYCNKKMKTIIYYYVIETETLSIEQTLQL
jgi:hypothetical protein